MKWKRGDNFVNGLVDCLLLMVFVLDVLAVCAKDAISHPILEICDHTKRYLGRTEVSCL